MNSRKAGGGTSLAANLGENSNGVKLEGLRTKTQPKSVQITLKDGTRKDFVNFSKNLQKFELNLQGIYEITALRMDFSDENALKAANPSLFVRKVRGLIVSRRFDAFGSRMFSFMNALFFAKKTDLKFGFVWDNARLKDAEFCQLDDEGVIFAQDFLEKYSYTKQNLPFTHKFENTMPASFNLMSEAFKAPLYETWGHLASYYRPAWQNMKDLSEAEYKAEFRALFDSIAFSELYKDLLKRASVGFEFDAVHLREAEIVYGKALKNRVFGLWIYFFPAPILINLIKQRLAKSRKIMLFSDHKAYALDIKAHFSEDEQKSIFIASDFLPRNDLTKAQISFFELILMSKSSVIYGSVGSMFKLFASYLGDIEQVTINQLFEPSEQYELLKDGIKSAKIPTEFKVSCYAFLHRLGVILKKDDELESILKQGLECDKTNLGFLIKLAAFYAKKGDFASGEARLKEALRLDEKQVLGLLGGDYKDDAQVFSQNFDKGIYFCLVSNRFDELVRLKNERENAQKQGLEKDNELEKVSVEYASMRGELEKARSDFKAMQDNFLRAKADFKAALSERDKAFAERDKVSLERDKALGFKEHLSYKLGNSLIKAYKTPLHSGLMKFAFCDVWRIYKDFKAKNSLKTKSI